jgi:hypothetical protein
LLLKREELMATKARPEVKVDLGGKVRVMKFDLNAMAEYEELTGKNILSRFNTKNMGARELRALLFACLSGDDETLTLKDVGSWVTPATMNEISSALTDAFSASVPESEGKKGRPLPKMPPLLSQ